MFSANTYDTIELTIWTSRYLPNDSLGAAPIGWRWFTVRVNLRLTLRSLERIQSATPRGCDPAKFGSIVGWQLIRAQSTPTGFDSKACGRQNVGNPRSGERGYRVDHFMHAALVVCQRIIPGQNGFPERSPAGELTSRWCLLKSHSATT